MRVLDQQSMQQLFARTDQIPLDREAIEVPLEMEGEGNVECLPNGKLRITLPDSDDLELFLESLPTRIAKARGGSR